MIGSEEDRGANVWLNPEESVFRSSILPIPVSLSSPKQVSRPIQPLDTEIPQHQRGVHTPPLIIEEEVKD